MKKLEMYCITLNNNHAKIINALGYVPVGLGKNITSDLFIRDNSKLNILIDPIKMIFGIFILMIKRFFRLK